MTQLALTNPSQATALEIAEYGAIINASVSDGNISAKDALIFATRLSKFSEAIITPELRDLAAKEAEKYAKGDRTYLGAKMTVKEVKGKPAEYDFTAVREWRALQDQINELLAQEDTINKPFQDQISVLSKQIMEIGEKMSNAVKLIKERIVVLETRQKEVEKSSITGQADADSQVHECAVLVKPAVKSTQTISIQIL